MGAGGLKPLSTPPPAGHFMLARLLVCLFIVAVCECVTSWASFSRTCTLLSNDYRSAHCSVPYGTLLLIANVCAEVFVILAAVYIFCCLLRTRCMAIWMIATAETCSYAVVLLDMVAALKTGMHLPDYWMPLPQFWASTVGLRWQMLSALVIAAAGGAALSGLTGVLTRRLSCAVAHRASDARSMVGAWQPDLTCKWSQVTFLATGVVTAALWTGLEYQRASSCRPAWRSVNSVAAWNAMPFHLVPLMACSNGTISASPDLYAPPPGAGRCGPEPAPRVLPVRPPALADAGPLKPGAGATQQQQQAPQRDFEARNQSSIILVVIDSLPAREFVPGVPETHRRTSLRFRRKVNYYFDQKRCALLPRHYAGSSYTHDAMYALLHGAPALAYTDEKMPWAVGPDSLRLAGYQTAMFLNGAVGYDFCTQRDLADGGGTGRFNTSTVVASDGEVTDAALAWLAGADAGRPFFLSLYYEGPHVTYGSPATFEAAVDSVLNSLDAVLAAVHAAGSDVLLLVTADHGCAVPGVDPDCPAPCEGHGWGTFGRHATDMVAHIPLWMCPLGGGEAHRGRVEALAGAAAKLPVTSALDVMPTLLDFVKLDPMPPIHSWSAGQSWLAPGAGARHVAVSVSRLKCELEVALIGGGGVAYQGMDVSCVVSAGPGARHCLKGNRTVEYPPWAAAAGAGGAAAAGPDPRESAEHLSQRVVLPALNRFSLPHPPAPTAFLICLPCGSGKGAGACLRLRRGGAGGGGGGGGEAASIALDAHPNLLDSSSGGGGSSSSIPIEEFLWKEQPGGRFLHVLDTAFGAAARVDGSSGKPVLATGAGEVLSGCQEKGGGVSIRFVKRTQPLANCFALQPQRPWLLQSIPQLL